MKCIKPTSYWKAHNTEVLQDAQESLMLLQMLAQSHASLETGDFQPLPQAFEEVHQQLKKMKKNKH